MSTSRLVAVGVGLHTFSFLLSNALDASLSKQIKGYIGSFGFIGVRLDNPFTCMHRYGD